MAGVTIEYKGAKIAELSEKGTKTIKTSGKYCEDDITVDYTGGVELPALTNEGAAADLMEGKQLISSEGEAVTGSFTLRTEMNDQSALIARIKSALAGKVAGGGGEQPNERDKYQRVEYITSAVEETFPYIITDFYADNTCGMEVIASFPKMQDRIPMGSRTDGSTATRFYCVYPLSTSSVYYGFNGGSSISCSTSVNTIYVLQTNFLNSRLVNVYEEDGTRKASASLNATLAEQTVPVSIFGYNSGSSGMVSSKREYKLYGARCSRKHEVVREYIPCYRKSDGVVGVFEKFTGQFLTSAVDAVFAKGADIDW